MSEKPVYLGDLDKANVQAFINSFDTIFTDCDGVLWVENRVIENSEKTLNRMRQLGKNVYYITNNSTKTREEFVKKCQNLGFDAKWDEIISTAYLAAEYFSSIKFNKKVYVIGSRGITDELDRFGIRHTDVGPDLLEKDLEEYINNKFKLDPEVGAVLIGFDQYLSYPKILKGANYLRNRDCLFVATNGDENFVIDDLLIPGTGSLLKCLETATGRQAYVIGKPNDYIRESATKKSLTSPSRTLMIGDKCNTDILFGKKCGFQTLLVLSGVTDREELTKFAASLDPSDRDLVPKYYINKLGDLLRHLS
ncbi:UNVERIFIED_CONTAM: hypothetical protein PYX00_010214 [Menopon gallinae]|uniref:Phosphoglycolate phosphatase n=1 Tax=Menopon gallinae TaxID=328185 RepID=A0AAW2HE70_9NEOP